MTNKIMKTKTTLQIELEVAIIKEGKYYVAYCPALELSAYADTKEGSHKAFEEELDIFIKETAKRGTLEKYLLKNGWKLQHVPSIKYEPPFMDTKKFPGSSFIRQQVNIPVFV